MKIMKLSKILVVFVIAYTPLFGGEVHNYVQRIIDEGGVCEVKDIKVLDSKKHGKSMCLLNAVCKNSVRGLRRVVPCESQTTAGTPECPSLPTCLENAVVFSRDSTYSDEGKFEKGTEEKITSKTGESCILKNQIPSIYKVEGNSANGKTWDGFCMLNTECTIQNVKTPRYVTVCKPLDMEQDKEMKVCPSFSKCDEKQILPREPKVGQQLTLHRNQGNTAAAAMQASGHR